MSTYSINEVSKMFGLPPSTLRYYEESGILTDIARTSSNQRIYEERHINRLKSICCFKGTGMSIAQLQAFFAYEQDEASHIDDILALLSGQKDQVEHKLMQLMHDLAHIKRKLAYYGDIKQAREAGSPLPDCADYSERSFS